MTAPDLPSSADTRATQEKPPVPTSTRDVRPQSISSSRTNACLHGGPIPYEQTPTDSAVISDRSVAYRGVRVAVGREAVAGEIAGAGGVTNEDVSFAAVGVPVGVQWNSH